MSRLGPSGLVARRRTVRIILLVVLASTLLVACGDGPVPTTTLPASIPASKAGSEPTDQERAVADALVRFARSENAADLDPVALAEDVSLGLGPELVLTRTPEALAIPENWVLDRPAFRAYASPSTSTSPDPRVEPRLRGTSFNSRRRCFPGVSWPAHRAIARQKPPDRRTQAPD